MAETFGSGSFGKGFEELGEFDPTVLRVDFTFEAEDFVEVDFEAPFALLLDVLEEAVTDFSVELRRCEDDACPFEPAALDADLTPFRPEDDLEADVLVDLETDAVTFDFEVFREAEVFFVAELAWRRRRR